MNSLDPSPTTTPADLTRTLRDLGLRKIADDLPDLVARATKGRFSPVVLLEEIARIEKHDRAARSLARRMRYGKLGRFKPVADFDWNWPTKIDRAAVERVLSLSFLDRAENPILIANQGLGKTMIAKNVAHAAVLAGHSALFVTAADLLMDLDSRDSGRMLHQRIGYYARPRVLVLDEIGYLSYQNRAADLLYQVVARRHEVGPTVVTTNLAFSDWPSRFPNAGSAVALIDRLTHHSEIIVIEGQSYRVREAEEERKAKRTAAKPSRKTA